MAACCALEPAAFSVPLSCSAPAEPELDEDPASASFAAPHALSARVPASATPSGMARVLVLSFNSVPLVWTRTRSGRQGSTNDGDAREVRWTPNPGEVNAR